MRGTKICDYFMGERERERERECSPRKGKKIGNMMRREITLFQRTVPIFLNFSPPPPLSFGHRQGTDF